jgi:hypothetical protein
MTGKDEQQEIRREFADAVNMTRTELQKWLDTDESKSVGQSGDDTKSSAGGAESTGHRSGRRIVEILDRKVADLTDADYEHMKKVNGYVGRHLKQRPKDVEHSRWRYSLMNWGHDPVKK